MIRVRKLTTTGIMWVVIYPAGIWAEEKVPPPEPYIFNLGGLTEKQIEEVRGVPGVLEVTPVDGRVKVRWQPFNDKPWNIDGSKWITDAEKIYDFLAIKGKLGRTQWTHGGPISGRSGHIVSNGTGISVSKGVEKSFGMMFTDFKTGHNDIMALRCFSDSWPGQVEHEMLRGIAGTNVTVEPCGKGNVIVSQQGGGLDVAWLVSNQMFVKIDSCYDKEMVAAYIDRLGCVTPKDYKVSVDKWVENEIRWRIMQLNLTYAWEEANRNGALKSFQPHVTATFPNVFWNYGLPKMGTPHDENGKWLQKVRNFLWANRANFKYHPASGGFVLKDKDLYDPEHPPELPEELRGPPKPAEEKPETPKQGTTDKP